MKKLLVILLIGVLSINYAFAQKQLAKTLLWKVSGKGIPAPSYLFGTMHIICPGDLVVNPVINQSFSSTNQLFLELKLDEPGMMMDMMKGLKMKDTTTIKGLVGTVNFDSLSTIFKKSTGLPLNLMNTAKPILLTSMIYPLLLGCTPDSWDKTFERMAKEQKHPLQGLEKLAAQMEALEQIPYREQADMMMKMMYNLDSTKTVFLKMMEVYKSKDISAMYNMTTGDVDFGKFENALLTKRNNSWVPIIVAETKKTPTFFAFGAAHLAGENGVINLLKKAGLSVEPVLY